MNAHAKGEQDGETLEIQATTTVLHGIRECRSRGM